MFQAALLWSPSCSIKSLIWNHSGTPQRGSRLELEHLARRTLGTVRSRRGGYGLGPRPAYLDQHRSIGAIVDPQKATAWPTSDEGGEFVHRSSQDGVGFDRRRH
jgi:hypothetical protein